MTKIHWKDNNGNVSQVYIDKRGIKAVNTHYVKFEREGFTNISVQPKWTQPDVIIQYSFDGVDWTNAVSGTNIIRDDGNTILFRGKAPTDKRLFIDSSVNNKWITNTTKITGNLNYLLCDKLLGDEIAPTILHEFAYANMFNGCTSLKTAPDLPATNLWSLCYNSMFNGCTSLVKAPELPATKLGTGCYQSMFGECTSLVNAPELPAATKLGINCYSMMFFGCTSLTSITMHYTGNDIAFTKAWVHGIETVGTLYKAGTQFTESGDDTYPTTWTQVQI